VNYKARNNNALKRDAVIDAVATIAQNGARHKVGASKD
jgi:hypothetical protein